MNSAVAIEKHSSGAVRRLPVFSALIQKGGAGKTTVNSTFAEYCAIVRGLRVLVIDLDPQCNMSKIYHLVETDGHGIDALKPIIHPAFDPNNAEDVAIYNQRSSIADVYEGKEVLPYETFINSQNGYKGSLDIIPGYQKKLTTMSAKFSIGASEEEVSPRLSGVTLDEFVSQLSKFLAGDALSEFYDIVILDAGPSDNIFFRSVIFSATHIVCPYTPDEFTLSGVSTLMNVAQSPKRSVYGYNQLQFLGVLPSKISGTSKLAREYIKNNKEIYKDLHVPDGIYMQQTDELNGRKSNAMAYSGRAFSIFEDPKAKNRKHFEEVFSYFYNQVFQEAKA
ncbi:ParA family protein [Pseudomonas luteola]